MEEEAAARRRRSSRSRSKPPMEAVELRMRGEGGVVLSEQIVTKVSRFQTIEETVSHESVSVQESTMFVQTDAAIELQNSQNQKQEVTKSLTAKTGGVKKVRRSVRAQHTSVNGSAVRKSVAARQQVQAEMTASKEVQAEVAASKEVTQTTPVTTRSVSSSFHRTTDPNIARRLYEAATRGEVDLSKSVFWRFYKPIGEWWNYYPKTDNTYSPLSNCRYELAPGMMAMPNLSRRSLHGHYNKRSTARSSWYSGVDSDTEDFTYDDSRSVHSATAGGFVTRVTSRVKRVIVSTITTIITIISLLYSYTLGAVVSAVIPGSTTSDESRVPLWLLPVHWLMGLARRLMLLEAWLLSLLGVGQRRNLLMFLLLLLLFGVPVYLLYAGQWSATSLVSDKVKDGLVNAHATLSTSLSWLLSMTGSVLHILATPVYWLFSTLTTLGVTLAAMVSTLATYLQAPFLWIMGGAISEQTVQEKVTLAAGDAQPLQKLPRVAVEHAEVRSELDIELVSRQVLESDAFKALQLQLAAQQHQQQQEVLVDSSASQFAQLGEELRQLRADLLQLRQSAGLHPRHAALHREVRGLERRIRLLQVQQLSERCCDKVEEQVVGAVAALFGQSGETLTPAEVAALVSSKLETLGQVESRLDKFAADIDLLQQQSFAGTSEPSAGAAVHMAGGVSEDRVRQLVKEALAIYDADKTNVVDYALETSGGTILSTRCTENYDYKHGVTFYWGLSWFSKEYRPNNPRAIIQPSVNPGECWAFKGATGYVVIELSTRIHVMAVTMEHVPRTLTPFGSIESAPKDFRVLGLHELNDPSPVLLGKFRYEDKDEPLQMFQVETSHHEAFQRIELQIESNHGHLEYTCVYRFRVHGVPAPLS